MEAKNQQDNHNRKSYPKNVKKVIRLKENDIENLVKKILQEEKSINEVGYKGGMTFGPFKDIVDSVTDRYRIYREQYRTALDEFHKNWPLDPTKVRTIPPGGGTSYYESK